MKISKWVSENRFELFLLLVVYVIGLYLRIYPRLQLDQNMMGFLGDAWYRIAIPQYLNLHGVFPSFSMRYQICGWVPNDYPSLGSAIFFLLSRIFNCGIPVVCTRIVPFLEALTPMPFYYMVKYLFGRKPAMYSVITLSVTPAFVVWTGISDPISYAVFIFPLIILLFIKHAESTASGGGINLRRRARNILIMGALFGSILLMHLSYFLIMPVFLSLAAYLALRYRKGPWRKIISDALLIITVSLLVTAPWWARHNLFWWWLNGLTSPGHGEYPDWKTQSKWYGPIASYGTLIITAIYAAYLSFYAKTRAKNDGRIWYLLLPLVLLLAPLYGIFAEKILKVMSLGAMSQSNIIKPLRADRFHVFLTFPFAMIFGIILAKAEAFFALRPWRWVVWIGFAVLLLGIYVKDVPVAVYQRIKWVPQDKHEYMAALWFKDNSLPSDRIIADYHRGQMFAGVAGGKALLGLPLPLKDKLPRPYLNKVGTNGILRSDMLNIYIDDDPLRTKELMDKYGCTHVLVSEGTRQKGFIYGLNTPGARINYKKFENTEYFEKCYDWAGVSIFKLKRPLAVLDDHKVENYAMTARAFGESQAGRIIGIDKINDNSLGNNLGQDAARSDPAVKGESQWAWFGLDFGRERTIGRIMAYPALYIYPEKYEGKGPMTYTAKRYILQYWRDGKWADIPGTEVDNNTSVMIEHSFAPIKTSKIRLYIFSEYDDRGTMKKDNHYRASCLELGATS